MEESKNYNLKIWETSMSYEQMVLFVSLAHSIDQEGSNYLIFTLQSYIDKSYYEFIFKNFGAYMVVRDDLRIEYIFENPKDIEIGRTFIIGNPDILTLMSHGGLASTYYYAKSTPEHEFNLVDYCIQASYHCLEVITNIEPIVNKYAQDEYELKRFRI